MISIEMEPEIESRLDSLASEEGKSTSEWLRSVILEVLEDIDDCRVARERLRNPGRRWTQEEMEREVGLAD